MEETELDTEKPDTDYKSLADNIKEVVENKFKDMSPLTEVTAFKWVEVLDNVFGNFEHSKSILTTENYNQADFTGKKMQWDVYRFRGDFSILNACKTMDNTIKKFCEQKNFIRCLKNEDANTRDIWIKANTLMEDEAQEPYEQYMSESIEFWQTAPENDPHAMFKLYHRKMAKKYDKTFIRFMEAQGYATYRNWMYFGKTALSKHFIQQFTELQDKYREKPFIINGSVTMDEHMDESASWKLGLKDTKKETNVQLENRRKHPGGEDIRNPKRIKLESSENSQSQQNFGNYGRSNYRPTTQNPRQAGYSYGSEETISGVNKIPVTEKEKSHE